MTVEATRPAIQRPARQARSRTRDAGYLTAGAVFMAAALFGVISAVALVAGSPLGSKGGANGSGALSLATVRATATALMRTTESRATKARQKILRDAREEARLIIADARRSSHHHRQIHHQHGRTTPPTPVPPRVMPTAQIPGAPNLNAFPKSWEIVVFDLQPFAGTVKIVNRTQSVLSGTVVVSYLRSNGSTAGIRRARFSFVRGRSVAALTIPPAPRAFARLHIAVADVTSP